MKTYSRAASHDRLDRTFTLAAVRSKEGEGRRYQLSFSSEEPYERWFGVEILDHSAGAVNLSRLIDLGVLLFNHRTDSVLGRVETAGVEGYRGIAEVSFDDDDQSEAVRKKVDSGTLKGVSVGYSVDVWEEVAAGKQSTCGRFTGPCFIARKWTPLEISIVAVPADATVGVGRSADSPKNDEMEETVMPPKNDAASQQAKGAAIDISSEVTQDSALDGQSVRAAGFAEGAAQERTRTGEITAMCRDFQMDPEPYIKDGSTPDQVRTALLEQLKKAHAPIPVSVERDASDNFRSAARDALLMRGGVPVEKPAPGASDLRGLRLRDLMNLCAREAGIVNPERMDVDDLNRAFYSPDAAFPAILDQTVQKAYEQGYITYPATFDAWTVKGSLSDFKPTKGAYRMGGAGDFLPVSQGGEIKHDTPSDHLMPERKLATYGRQFSLSREALINDDIGFVTSIPARYAAAARRTLNKQVYSVLSQNPVIYDGTPLFSSDHKNMMAVGKKPSIPVIKEMIKLLMLQKSEDGEYIAAVPRHVLCAVGEGDDVRQFIYAATAELERDGIKTILNNPLSGRGLEIIEEPYLNLEEGPLPWYMAADKSVVPCIQVDYLNGNEIPIIRRSERPGQLGYIWDFYLDWGITVTDYRGIAKNPGSI